MALKETKVTKHLMVCFSLLHWCHLLVFLGPVVLPLMLLTSFLVSLVASFELWVADTQWMNGTALNSLLVAAWRLV